MIARSTLIASPGYILAPGPVKIRCKGLITVKLAWQTEDITDALKGKFTKIVKDRWIEIDFTPLYYDPSVTIGILYPYISQAALPIGSDIYTTSDTPWSVVGSNGDTILVKAGALVKMPDIRLGADQDIQGSCQVIGINATGTDPSSTSSFYTISTGNSFTYPTVPGTSTLARQKYTGVMTSGPTGLTSFQSTTGFKVSHELGLQWIYDSGSRVGALFTGYRSMVKCLPTANSIANAAAAMAFSGSGASQGQRLDALAAMVDLVISGAASVTVTAKNATMESCGFAFAAEQLRQGEVGFVTNIEDTSGAPQDALVLA